MPRAFSRLSGYSMMGLPMCCGCMQVVIHTSATRCIDVVAPPSQHMQRVLDVLFWRGAVSNRARAVSSQRHARSLCTASLPLGRNTTHQKSSSSGRLDKPLSQCQSLDQLQRSFSTVAGACCTPAPKSHSRGTGRRAIHHASDIGRGQCGSEKEEQSIAESLQDGSSAAATDPVNQAGAGASVDPANQAGAGASVAQQPPQEEEEWEYEGKRRWSYAEKRAARIERLKVADEKRQKKMWKTRRKNRMGRARSIARHTGHEIVVVVPDMPEVQ